MKEEAVGNITLCAAVYSCVQLCEGHRSLTHRAPQHSSARRGRRFAIQSAGIIKANAQWMTHQLVPYGYQDYHEHYAP